MNDGYDVVLFTGCQGSLGKTFGAYKCAHELRKAGFRTIVINYLHEFNLHELQSLATKAIGSKTLFVGFSNSFLISVPYTQRYGNIFLPSGAGDEEKFIKFIKNINPSCKIVIGGCQTFVNIQNPNIDYAVIGYADLSIVNLANHLDRGDQLKNSIRTLNRVTVINDPLASGFDFANSTMLWTDDDIVVNNETLPIEISRGCIFSCKFCSFPLNGKKQLDYLKNFDTIRDELIYNYKKYNITHYRILDDTFNDTEQKLDIMLKIVKSLPFKPRFWAYIRLDLLCKHPHTIQKLVDIGVHSMFFGIETLNQSVGKLIGKAFDPVKQIETINYIKKIYGNQVFILGSFICGLPTETKESVYNTMNKLYNHEIMLDHAIYNTLSLVKTDHAIWHSAFNLDLRKYGYRQLPNHADDTLLNWENDCMTRTDASNMCHTFRSKFISASHGSVFKTNNILHNTHVNSFIPRYKKQAFSHVEKSSKGLPYLVGRTKARLIRLYINIKNKYFHI